MEGTKTRRVLIISNLIILLCMAIILGMTWALFTDTAMVKNHLQAGDLKIKLERTELEKITLNDKGYFTTDTYSTDVNAENTAYRDFTGLTKENVFDIQNGERIVPGATYVAKMKITNQGDVAFKYWIQIATQNDPENQPSSAELAKQLDVTVTVLGKDGRTVTKRLDASLFVGSEADAIGVLGINDYSEFTVTVKFVDDREDETLDNDAAQGKQVYFDLVVHAVQYTGDAVSVS